MHSNTNKTTLCDICISTMDSTKHQPVTSVCLFVVISVRGFILDHFNQHTVHLFSITAYALHSVSLTGRESAGAYSSCLQAKVWLRSGQVTSLSQSHIKETNCCSPTLLVSGEEVRVPEQTHSHREDMKSPRPRIESKTYCCYCFDCLAILIVIRTLSAVLYLDFRN